MHYLTHSEVLTLHRASVILRDIESRTRTAAYPSAFRPGEDEDEVAFISAVAKQARENGMLATCAEAAEDRLHDILSQASAFGCEFSNTAVNRWRDVTLSILQQITSATDLVDWDDGESVRDHLCNLNLIEQKPAEDGEGMLVRFTEYGYQVFGALHRLAERQASIVVVDLLGLTGFMQEGDE